MMRWCRAAAMLEHRPAVQSYRGYASTAPTPLIVRTCRRSVGAPLFSVPAPSRGGTAADAARFAGAHHDRMALFHLGTDRSLTEVPPTNFAAQRVLERADLQAALRDHIAVLG